MKYDTVIFSSASGGGGPTPPHLPVSLKWSAGSGLFDEGWSKYISSSRADGPRWKISYYDYFWVYFVPKVFWGKPARNGAVQPFAIHVLFTKSMHYESS